MLTDGHLDRIYEAYNGLLGEHMKEMSRQRFDWICDNTIGKNILDVGCSQGIGPILLGRRGLHVTGVDIEQTSIDYARSALANEDYEVQDSVDFICEDFLEVSFEEKYDTVIMAEILEHLETDLPGSFVEKARGCLHKNGRIIATVPFGINDFPDHKRTYYFADIYTLISNLFTVIEVKFFGKWIGLIGEKNDDKNKNITFNTEIILEEEQNFHKIERSLLDQLAANELKLKNIFAERDKYLTELDAVKTDNNSNKVKLEEATSVNRQLETKLRQARDYKIKIERDYSLLANSKLGKLTLKYWSIKDKYFLKK